MQYTYHCFDWDDNLIFMPTNIVLFHKDTEEEIILSTEDFATYRSDIGKDKEFYIEGDRIAEKKNKEVRNFQDYMIIGDGEHKYRNSFREFRDCDQKYFIKHLKEALHTKDFGPEWNLFAKATEDADNAKQVYIITARGHSAHTIYEGIKYLKEIGLIKHHIPRKNIYPVSHEKFKGTSSNPQVVKLKILKRVFKEANEKAKKEQLHHTVYFSDDDLKTIKHLKEKLSKLRESDEKESKKSYWQHIHIRLRYTGNLKIRKKVMVL